MNITPEDLPAMLFLLFVAKIAAPSWSFPLLDLNSHIYITWHILRRCLKSRLWPDIRRAFLNLTQMGEKQCDSVVRPVTRLTSNDLIVEKRRVEQSAL